MGREVIPRANIFVSSVSAAPVCRVLRRWEGTTRYDFLVGPLANTAFLV